MFQRKFRISYYPAAIAAGLVVTIAVVVASLVEAVSGMQSYL